MAATARFLVPWGTPADPAAWERYYHDIHLPLAKKIPGLRSYSISRGLTPVRPGTEPVHLIAELSFDTLEDLRAGFASPEGKATAAYAPTRHP